MDRQIAEFRKTIPRTHQVNFHPAFITYFDWLAREAAGAAPDAWAVVREHGLGTLMKVLTGPITPMQWRLVGRDKWEGAKEVLEDVSRRFQGGILDAQVKRRMTKSKLDWTCLCTLVIAMILYGTLGKKKLSESVEINIVYNWNV